MKSSLFFCDFAQTFYLMKQKIEFNEGIVVIDKVAQRLGDLFN